jgi:hypothetical protein
MGPRDARPDDGLRAEAIQREKRRKFTGGFPHFACGNNSVACLATPAPDSIGALSQAFLNLH